MAFIIPPPTVAATIAEKQYSDPAHLWYGASGININTGAGAGGDPFLVYDTANSQWIMYLWESVVGAPFVRCYYLTAPTLEGPWGGKTQMASLANYHKPALLVDTQGAPVQIGSLYHMYGVYYNGALSDKVVYHFTGPTLVGPWTLGSNVIPRGAAGSKDEFSTDTPYAVFSNGTIYIYYMGAPVVAQPIYGIAIRMLLTASLLPDGPFTKTGVDVLTPSTAVGDWDYGWLGGTQVRLRPDGTYIMVYNAGDTRPPVTGQEPAASRIGYAYAANVNGPWAKDSSNPYFNATGSPSTLPEQTNIWRGHIQFEPKFNQWYCFYNAGVGVETVTLSRQGEYSFFYGVGTGSDVQNSTVAAVAVVNSRVNLPPGNYAASYTVNYIGSSVGAVNPLDIDTVIRVNGVAVTNNQGQSIASRLFVNSYAFENDDTTVTWGVSLTTPGYVDITTQVIGGVPTAFTNLRRLRVNIVRVGNPV